MASIRVRNGKFCVIYYVEVNGKRTQKWETYKTRQEAQKRKKEVEYRQQVKELVVPQCTTLKDLFDEYVELYGKEKWSLSTYERNLSQIRNYIVPLIGDKRITDINAHFLEKYYKGLLRMAPVENHAIRGTRNEFVSTCTIRDIHKLMRNCLEQAVKWELIPRNPAKAANVPKHKSKKREIWTADTLMYALSVCEDKTLALAINLSFAASLRMGEILGLTWDCVDISYEAIEQNRAFVYVNKELQRVTKNSITQLEGKDIILIFPSESETCRTVRVLKSPKTESSIRKVFLPKSVALQMAEWKRDQDQNKKIFGSEFHDYGLVLSTAYGFPVEGAYLRHGMNRLSEKHGLPKVVFHSIRHSSVTYKLKLNGGDIKAVQGDSGHSQVNMVTDVYSHIIDDDRRKNAEMFERAFYARENLDPVMHEAESGEQELIGKLMDNPDLMAVLKSLVKLQEGMEKKGV